MTAFGNKYIGLYGPRLELHVDSGHSARAAAYEPPRAAYASTTVGCISIASACGAGPLKYDPNGGVNAVGPAGRAVAVLAASDVEESAKGG